MIKELKMYTVICDGCGKDVCEGDEYAAWNEVSAIEDLVKDFGWLKHDDYDGTKHYCPKCYDYDDDDNLVIHKKENQE